MAPLSCFDDNFRNTASFSPATSPLDRAVVPLGSVIVACQVLIATGGSWHGIIERLLIKAPGVKQHILIEEKDRKYFKILCKSLSIFVLSLVFLLLKWPSNEFILDQHQMHWLNITESFQNMYPMKQQSFLFTTNFLCVFIYYNLSMSLKIIHTTVGQVEVSLLKLVSAIFYQIFISHQMIALKNLWTTKKLISFSRYWNFCIFNFPFFSPSQPLL